MYGGASPTFHHLNLNKKDIAFDMKNEKGKKIFSQLVEKSDVVVTNFVPGTMERLGIGYEDLKVFEDLEFLKSVVEGRPGAVTFADALAAAEVEAAMTRSWESGAWEDVTSLRID